MKFLLKLRSLFSNPIVSNMVLLLVVYTGIRGVFLSFHYAEYSADSWGALCWAFFTGLRFDLAAIAFSNIPYLTLTLLPEKITERRMFQGFLKTVFLVCNIVILSFMIADIRYYQFTGSRITADVFLLKSEAATQSTQLLLNYWYLLLIFVPTVYILNRFYRKLPSFNDCPWSLSKFALSRLGMVALTVVAARGGVQLKPLKPLHAFAGGDQELGILSLNSGFTLIRSHFDNGLSPAHDFATEEEVEKILAQKKLPEIQDSKKQNVVIFIIESYASEFFGAANNGKGYTPFLDTLTEKGLFFKNNFANGRRSIEGLPSVLFGVPSLMPTPIAQSNFQTNRWVGLGQLLGAEGYHTSFFHGAKSGTMYFDAISRSAGMNDYITMEKYPEAKRDFDGSWGIYDEPFLQFMAGNLAKQAEPFFSVVFTLSSHQPYRVPDQHKDRFPPGELKIHQSIQYVDYS
ncbi:MAG: sulfatase-like hydrolase/transferase, partial [Verrucomicrobia bacterium]|nr:sulfatase-like hydrolase/transferase [Verrucomicrobiota bacterium]